MIEKMHSENLASYRTLNYDDNERKNYDLEID